MVTFPNCKINLGLNILQKREDGYHDIETVFLPIPFYEVLEIISSDNSTTLTTTGISAGDPEDNLCLKAFHLLKRDFPSLPEIKMHLHKIIPVGAGLGGGSADAAFALLLLNKKFDLQIPATQLFEYALQLGSDCPFFISNKPCFARGRGEIIEEIGLSLSSYKILLINPGIHINTKETFQYATPAIPLKKIKSIIQQPIATWKDALKNDFEKVVFSLHPEIKKIKENLYTHGAIYASMTGTGSTIFGIFNKNDQADHPIEKEYFHKWINLS